MNSFLTFSRAELVGFSLLIAVYFFFAPNYSWPAASSLEDMTDARSELSSTPYGADFLQEWIGARMILSGHSSELYNVEIFRKWQHDESVLGFAWKETSFFPPVYPPVHYALFMPLACLPYRWAALLWVTCLIASAFIAAKLIVLVARNQELEAECTPSSQECNRTQWFWLALILFPSMLFSITLGQKSCVWLLILCVAWRLLRTNRTLTSGIVFGLLSVKPTLFFLIPLVLLWNGHKRFFAGAAISVITLWGGALLIVPLETLVSFVKLAGQAGSYAESNGYQLDWSCNLMTIAYSMPMGWVAWCKWAMCFPLAAYVLYACFADRDHEVTSPHKLMMMLCTTLLISPHTYHYDLCLLLLPILWLATDEWRTSLVYYALLAIGVAISAQLQALLHVPAIPILLVGILCELRLRRILSHQTDAKPAIEKQALNIVRPF